jgi:type IV pilus assembly protein PilQ
MPGNQEQVVVSFPGLNIPASHQKLYNLQKFESKAKSALLQATEKGGRLTLKVQERFPVHIDKQDSTFILSFKRQANTEQGLYTSSKTAESLKNGGSEVAVRANPEQVEDTEPEQELQELNTLFPGMKEDYTGKPISIDVQDADVEHILRLIAEISDFNLIIDQNVGGRISLKLEEVPWDQALDLVLLQKDLGMVKKGNILRIATREKLENEREQRREARKAALEAKKSLEELEPLKTEYIQINYTKASQIESQVSNFLSDRGQISNDPRTNLLIVSDIQDRIDKIRRVIRKLDRPERQVLIEARVVYATDSFSKSLGISWGFAGAEQYKILGTEMSSTLDGFVLNPPAGPETLGFTATGSHIATQAIDFFNLDAQLKLGETQNVARTVSSPRIVTLNNQAANISQGVKIATSGESESGGTTTEYVDATLNLSVTPQITPDDKLILDLNISDDSPASGGDIDTRTAATRLIVDDKETIVLGGVHQVTENDIENSVPGLKDIPLFSWLFKNQSITNTKRELLIFIRTKILE